MNNTPYPFPVHFFIALALTTALVSCGSMPQQETVSGGGRASQSVAVPQDTSAGGASTGQATAPAGIDPQAQNLLQASMAYLGSQKQFSADTRSTIEMVLVSGQKLQFDNTVTMSVQRPNKLVAKRVGDLIDQAFYYDGNSLTLHNPSQGYYATVPAPGTLEEMLDFARVKLDVVAPGGDFLYRNAFEILMQDVTDGFVVGKGVVDGVRCVHLAFRAPHVDWQIWIQEGKQPLPRKIVITSRDIVNAPQFTVVITKWNLAPALNEGLFKFKPPKDARRVDFLPL